MREIISAAELGDRRRNARAFDLVQWLMRTAVRGGGAASGASAWAIAMAAWRFFNNGAIALAAAYDIVRAAIREALGAADMCFVAHDVSLLDYTRHNAKADRIPIGDHRGAGYELYSALVLTAQGRPLGPVFQEIRVEGGCASSEPLAPRERARGLAKFVGHIEQMEKAVGAVKRYLAGVRVVHLADREFDDLEAMRAWTGSDLEFIVRAQHLSRRVQRDGVHDSLAHACSTAKLRRGGVVERDGVRYRRWCGEIDIVFDGRSWRGRHRGVPSKLGTPIELRIVIVELRAAGHETIQWVLLTNVREPLEWIVQAYLWRWRIERYFYLAKVGFRLETWTQQTGEAIARRLALTSLAAMTLHHVLALKDEDPEARDAIQTIAALGGWLGRKRDPIGPIVLMRGITNLLNAIAAVQDLGPARLEALAERVLPGFRQRRSARSDDEDL